MCVVGASDRRTMKAEKRKEKRRPTSGTNEEREEPDRPEKPLLLRFNLRLITTRDQLLASNFERY